MIIQQKPAGLRINQCAERHIEERSGRNEIENITLGQVFQPRRDQSLIERLVRIGVQTIQVAY